MEFFKFCLFGISGASMIFWVCVIAIWHVEAFPSLVKDDLAYNSNQPTEATTVDNQTSQYLERFGLRPPLKNSSLKNRSKFVRKSFVVADFNPISDTYKVDRLITSTLISLGIMSFLLIIYGLHSVFRLIGIPTLN